MKTKSIFLFATILFTAHLWSQWEDKFKQMDDLLPTPNVYRTASGAPGHQYYQQKADYKITLELDDEKQIIRGEETITYTNNSPDPLSYLWLQLDQNQTAKKQVNQRGAHARFQDHSGFRTPIF